MFHFLEKRKDAIWSWAQRHAEGPHATFWLAFVAFVEASFFPIPPGILLIAILISNVTQKWWYYAGITTLFSVAGGLFGYLIGALFFDLVGQPLIAFYGLETEFQSVSQKFANHAFLAMFTAAFTPIPFKVFTIAAGVFRIDISVFIIASVLGRGIRYFIMGYVLYIFGDHISRLLYRYFNIASLVFVAAVLLGVYLFVG